MSEETTLKDLQEEIDEMKDYPVKLSWKNVWIICTTIVTLIGSSFGIGMKVDYESQKIIQLKQERQFEIKLSEKEDELLKMKRELSESKEDNIFYMNRFNIIKERYDKCIKGGVLLSSPDNTIIEKDN